MDPDDLAAEQPGPGWRGRLRRGMAVPVWRLVRPVARPVLWRVRGFLAADAVRELAALRAAQEEMHRATREEGRRAAREAVEAALLATAPPAPVPHEPPRMAPYGGPAAALCLGDTAAERWLLTVALLDAAAQRPAQPA